MPTVETSSLSQKLAMHTNRNLQLDFFKQVNTIISNGGLSKENLEEIGNTLVDGMTIGQIVELNIREGNIVTTTKG